MLGRSLNRRVESAMKIASFRLRTSKKENSVSLTLFAEKALGNLKTNFSQLPNKHANDGCEAGAKGSHPEGVDQITGTSTGCTSGNWNLCCCYPVHGSVQAVISCYNPFVRVYTIHYSGIQSPQ